MKTGSLRLRIRGFGDKGVVNESCFPYRAREQSCSARCSSWGHRVHINDVEGFFPGDGEDQLKRMLIRRGAVSSGIKAWRHAMHLVGYRKDQDGRTVWIFKNSWGTGWGNGGYGGIVCSLSQLYDITYAPLPPVSDDAGNLRRRIAMIRIRTSVLLTATLVVFR